MLPIALRAAKDTEVVDVICALSEFFKELHGKELSLQKLDEIGANVVITLSKMEKMFPPSFFTIMVHLVVHLTEEEKLGGLFSIDGCTNRKVRMHTFSFKLLSIHIIIVLLLYSSMVYVGCWHS